MAKRYRTRQIPGDYSEGKGIFPIVPFRIELSILVAALAINVGQELELNLDFDYQQVFDVMMIDSSIMFTYPTTLVDGNVQLSLALTDDPNKATATNISTLTTANTGEATFENDQSMVYFHDYIAGMNLGEASVAPTTDRKMFIFEQPWIVARNMKWIFDATLSTANSFIAATARITLWGRRRRASESEFYSIVQRQRF